MMNSKNIWQEFSPLADKKLQILDDEGKVIAFDWMPEIADDKVVEAYKLMLYSRTADQMIISFQRQGRIYTYPPNLGQEAAAVGSAMAFEQTDWMVPAFREMGAMLHKGATLKDIFLYFGGHEDGSTFPKTSRLLPMAVPIASQCLHAVGLAYGLKHKGLKDIVYCYFGDGATSEGDFHEAMNFAGVWKAPVVFICQNNQYAISVPRAIQTASRNIAMKSVAYGMQGILVDGNDFFAVYAASYAAAEHARQGNGPVLIEALTYRMAAHTTSDDPTRYRTCEEEELWKAKDPLKRLRNWLIGNGLWKESDEMALIESYKKDIESQFAEYENYPPYKVEDIFQYHFAEMPPELTRQKVAYEKFLATLGTASGKES